jgi:hypothetical protein
MYLTATGRTAFEILEDINTNLKTLKTGFAARLSVAPVALTDAATTTLDTSVSDFFTWTMGGSRTLALTNLVPGQTFRIQIKQDATGSRIVTWPAAFTWAGGTPGVLSTAANAVDELVATTFDGTTVRVILSKAYA